MVRALKGGDLFCGAGGMTAGLKKYCDRKRIKLNMVCVNHDRRAIATHRANYPEFLHVCASLLDQERPDELFDIKAVDPYKASPWRKLDILIAGPECTNHSKAKAGKPRDYQSRATADCCVRWADALKPDYGIIENVEDFLRWGPLNENGDPIPEREGEYFDRWVADLRNLGYTVEWRVLCAADYGAATTRERLFVLLARDRRPVRYLADRERRGEQSDGGVVWFTAERVAPGGVKGAGGCPVTKGE